MTPGTILLAATKFNTFKTYWLVPDHRYLPRMKQFVVNLFNGQMVERDLLVDPKPVDPQEIMW